MLLLVSTRQKPFPDDKILSAEDIVTPVKQVIKLVVWIAEFAETEFPETHVLEWTVCV